MVNNKLDKKKVGLVVGSLFGLLHLFWVILVNWEWGQAAVDLFYYLHFISYTSAIGTYSLTVAIGGVLAAFVIGYVIGWLFSALWNWFNKEKKEKPKRRKR